LQPPIGVIKPLTSKLPIERRMDANTGAQIRQRLLFMCTCCGYEPQSRYYTTALMDEVVGVLGCNLASAPADGQAEQLSLMICACMLMCRGRMA
jgi:hypothetical protein